MYNILVYDWDEAKRRKNLAKHGLDFEDAWLVYENPGKLPYPAPHDSENRQMDVAWVETVGKTLVLIYLKRGTKIRIISFRVASRKERRVYESEKSN